MAFSVPTTSAASGSVTPGSVTSRSVTSRATAGAGGATGITGTTASASTGTNDSGSKLGKAAGMGKDDFLTLLVAQLKNQDPMKPMEDREFVTQLAQFSSLEALEKLNEKLEAVAGAQLLGEAAGLIGKQVDAKLPDGTLVSGVVSRVNMIDGKPLLVVGAATIALDLITNVGAPPAPTLPAPTTGTTAPIPGQPAPPAPTTGPAPTAPAPTTGTGPTSPAPTTAPVPTAAPAPTLPMPMPPAPITMDAGAIRTSRP